MSQLRSLPVKLTRRFNIGVIIGKVMNDKPFGREAWVSVESGRWVCGGHIQMTSNDDANRAARKMIERYGDFAEGRARLYYEALKQQGDQLAAAIWERVLAEIRKVRS
jgi:hypothetical protein